ncbi:hypothetical protein AmaxDRAFT_0977 [Limnospira maxima CS-328]|uniref:Uncharacterized protein n=3 Tax=Limnospira TaxID=2596745 RepID=A0A9P1NZT0_9CYAN|nr:hypothetical protein AmaxDRAFT_0977 [Limnospira maxima CS-328]CDM96633.1 hypothetical protein ARTHRO_41042 [Limnospira indica PCC 8005]
MSYGTKPNTQKNLTSEKAKEMAASNEDTAA